MEVGDGLASLGTAIDDNAESIFGKAQLAGDDGNET